MRREVRRDMLKKSSVRRGGMVKKWSVPKQAASEERRGKEGEMRRERSS